MEWITLLTLVVFVLFVALAKKQRASSGDYPYQFNEQLFSPAERSFYGILNQATQNEAVVFGKVRVADVLSPPKGLSRSNWQKSFNRISSKHFDFVICSPDTLYVRAVVELDDKSHAKGKRAERDRFIEKACESAGVTLHRVNAAATYNVGEIRAMLFPPQQEALNLESSIAAASSAIPNQGNEQLCPKCTSVLVKKVAKKGEYKGAEFLACSAFPKCRYTAKINAPA